VLAISADMWWDFHGFNVIFMFVGGSFASFGDLLSIW